MGRTYTLREAAEITTKSYSALRGMVDRGQLATHGTRKPGRTRRVAHEELKRVGLLRAEEALSEPAVQELALQLSDLKTEIRNLEARLTQQLDRIEARLSASDLGEPELRAAA